MIDLENEKLLSVADVCQLVPKAGQPGKRISGGAVVRWMKVGLKAADGSIVKLEHAKCGGNLATTLACVERFFNALSDSPVVSSQPKNREELVRRLKAAGIYSRAEVAERKLKKEYGL